MLMLPPYMLIEDPIPKAILAALFALAALMAGKRIRWGYFATLLASITLFHLLAPWGRVLLEIGPFAITEGALRNGLVRGITLIGMVFLSVAAVRPELKLPGRFGGLVGRTFYHFEAIIDGKGRLSRRDFFGSLDRLLLERFDPDRSDLSGDLPTDDAADSSAPSRRSPRPRRGIPWAAVAALIPWLLWFVTMHGTG